MPALALVLVLVLVVGTAGACTDDAEKARRTPPQTATPSASASEASPRTEPSAAAERLPAVTSPYSLTALMAEEFSSERPRRTRTVLENEAYTEHEVLYRSGDVRVSGVLLVPKGPGPFPAVVLNHGYIEPSIYVSGQGLSREQTHLARAGFVVLHTDYRGHAASDPASDLDRETRLGYTRDAINAVHALREEPSVDPDRIAMLGRSMGGGVTMNALVAQPGLVKAAVIYASVSSDYLDNLRRWTLPERPESAQQLFRRFGSPRQRPGFYEGLSARTYFDRITEPVLAHHGTLDESCPLPWARTTQRLMTQAGVDSTLQLYEGEQHAFGPRWLDSMRLTVRFLRRELSA